MTTYKNRHCYIIPSIISTGSVQGRRIPVDHTVVRIGIMLSISLFNAKEWMGPKMPF